MHLHLPALNLTRTHRIALGAAAGILVASLLGYTAYAFTRQTTQPIAEASPSPTVSVAPTATASLPPATKKVANPINGMLVDPGSENIHPLAVMIENHPDARPQYGLQQADLVYEAIAEGGITRFMAVFSDPRIAVRVGPVRSARTYFVDFATELGAFYAHVGGSEPALAQIKSTGVYDLDQFSVGTAAYYRDYSRKVALEHTMYSSTDRLYAYAVNAKKWPATADVSPWQFEDDAPDADRPSSQKAVVDVSTASYDVTWDYDRTANDYKRTMAGAPHKDALTGDQITAKTIVLERVVDNGLVTESNGKQVSEFQLTGSGPATVIKNGVAITGTWQKTGTGRTRYYDASGKEIPMLRGKIWVQIVHATSTISIK